MLSGIFFLCRVFFCLAHQRTSQVLHSRSNLQTLFQNVSLPSDNHTRKILDEIKSNHFDSIFFNIVSDLRLIDALKPFKQFSNNFSITLDKSEYFNYHKIYCRNCSIKRYFDREIEYFYNFLRIFVATPSENTDLPLTSKFMTSQYRDKK